MQDDIASLIGSTTGPRPAALLRAALDTLAQGVLVLDGAGGILAANRAFAALFGLHPPHGQVALAELLARRGGALAPILPVPAAGIGAAARAATLADGRVVAVRWTELPGGGWCCSCEDLTEREAREYRLTQLTRRDSLTDLPNRAAFHEALQRALLSRSAGDDLAVLCVDLDRFKQVNELYGPRTGDEVLRQVAGRLRAVVREEDMLARLGSDEFALVQVGPRAAGGAEAMARRVVEALGRPFEVGGAAIVVGASVGVALAGADDWTDLPAATDALLRQAHVALSRGKQDGCGRWRLFASGMDEAMQARRALEQDLRQALPRGEFELHFQPLVSVRGRCVVAFEALLRWRHPARGLVRPDHFIPLAEQLGLIGGIGEWVLREACATAAGWPAGPQGPIRVAVNLSSLQFGANDLVGQVRAALADAGLPAALLELEITESVLLADNRATRDALHRLRALGVRVSIDDFGTGYSSLAYLNSFPVDKLKIDRRFVQALHSGVAEEAAGAAAIVRAIAGLGVSLGLDTTAEGVETRAQLDHLAAEGCTEMQGYFFSPPRPAREIPALLEAVARRAA